MSVNVLQQRTATQGYDIMGGGTPQPEEAEMDLYPTDGSPNPVTSNGIYDALLTKQDTLTFDSTPTDDSTNPVTSGGIYDALETKGSKCTRLASIYKEFTNVTADTWQYAGSYTITESDIGKVIFAYMLHGTGEPHGMGIGTSAELSSPNRQTISDNVSIQGRPLMFVYSTAGETLYFYGKNGNSTGNITIRIYSVG